MAKITINPLERIAPLKPLEEMVAPVYVHRRSAFRGGITRSALPVAMSKFGDDAPNEIPLRRTGSPPTSLARGVAGFRHPDGNPR
ncbi:MAG: hypothetical protein ACXVH3_38050, partial [Solirubrobacteraceae bacterium]